MAISETARNNHDELFPGHVSTLAATDPELIGYFDNFAFDEVLSASNLDTRTRLMIQLASMIACQAVREYRAMLGAALNVGVTSRRSQRERLSNCPLRRHGKGLRFHPRHQRCAHRTRNPVATRRPIDNNTEDSLRQGARRAESDRRNRTGGPDVRRRAGRRTPPPAALVGELFRRPPQHGPASICARASCSRSPCSSRPAAANPRPKDMSLRT